MQLHQRKEELEALAVDVLVVTFEREELATAYARDIKLPWPLLVDTTRSLFHAYGMDRGSAWQVYGPVNWWCYIKLLLRGRRLRRPTDDVHQLGGDVLIDPQGIVRMLHVTTTSTDRPSVDELLQPVRGNNPPAEPRDPKTSHDKVKKDGLRDTA